MDHIKIRKKDRHPKETANCLSILTFFYSLDLFKKGAKKPLEEDDLYEVLSKFNSKKMGDRMEGDWEKQIKNGAGLSIVRLCWKEYGWKYISLGAIQLVVSALDFTVHPYALGKLIAYFAPNQTSVSKYDAYFYASLVIGITYIHSLYIHQYHLSLAEMGMQIRTSLVSLIYRKALKLNPSRLEDISIGKIVTLITKDVASFEMFVHFANDLWIAIVKTGIICFLIYQRIGKTAFAGLGFFMIILPLQIYLGSLSSKLRMKMCKSTDERLKYTQETFSAIRIIKIYTWEAFFEKEIDDARKKEMRKMHQNFWLRAFILVTGHLNAKVAFYIVIMTYTWLGNYMTAEIVYYLMSSFHILTHTLSTMLPIGITQASEVFASIKRLGSLLKAMEIQTEEQDSSPSIEPKIVLNDISVEHKGREILQNVNLKLDVGLNLLTGAIGSGKTFLLKTILQDYESKGGKLLTRGRISYASQEPWLFPSTIRQNILFGEPYDEKRYAEVIRVCALLYDFELLSDGDGTIVEDRGGNLSKGQQARINLARAIYKEADIYLLDACLAALDAHVSDYIFNECFKKYLEGRLIILVSHNVNHVQNADRVILMRNGTIKSVVKPWELSSEEIHEIKQIKDKSNFKENDENPDVVNDDDDDDENRLNEDETGKLITETTAEKKVYKETKKTGKVNWNVYKKYFHFGGGFFVLLGVFILLSGSQFLHSYTEKLISQWVNVEQVLSDMIAKNISNLPLTSNTTDNLEGVTLSNLPFNLRNLSEEDSTTILDLSFNVTELPASLVVNLAESFIVNETIDDEQSNSSTSDILKNKTFTRLDYEKTLAKRNRMLLYYSILMVASAVGSFVSSISLLSVAKRASIKLHQQMVRKILHATMHFFDTNFVGNILNRFSRDLTSVDERLAFGFQHLTKVTLSIVGVVVLIATVNVTFLIPMAIFVVILIFLRRAYLVSGRNLKRLDAITRSPIVGHLNATLEGITTIRAFKTQKILRDEFDRFQDLHNSANYCFINSMAAFSFALEMLCATLVTFIITRFIVLDDGTSAGDVGLAISQALVLIRTLQWGIRQWTDLENNMTSVERALEYTDVKQETKSGQTLKNWPSEGEVIYKNVYLSYNDTDEYVLKNLNFTIKPKEKIGIVGRTGAGKSSIISSLFRLYEVKGKIIIDGVDIKTLTLDFLRKSMSIIPQEPVLFTGTIRENVDPLKIYTDNEIWQAIEKAHLKNNIPTLEYTITESGSNFSVGQRQLICLARALLRNNKIIVLDEATANMDSATDELIHDTIQKNFKDCTVITIAHKIKSIMDSDRIMVLEKGEIIEFDEPSVLLQNQYGPFYKMAEKAQLIKKNK